MASGSRNGLARVTFVTFAEAQPWLWGTMLRSSDLAMSQPNDQAENLAQVLPMPAKAAAVAAERRKHPRYHLRCDATLHSGPGKPGATVTLSDVSLGGCYVETSAISPIGTQILIKFEICGLQISAVGRVTTSHPMVGMGIAFESASPEVEELVRRLAQGERPVQRRSARDAAPEIAASTADPQPAPVVAAVALSAEQTHELARALVSWFDAHPHLSRAEFVELLQAVIGGSARRR